MQLSALTGNGKDTDDLQCSFDELALLDTVTHGTTRRLEIARHVPAHLDHGSLTWVAVRDIKLGNIRIMVRKNGKMLIFT